MAFRPILLVFVILCTRFMAVSCDHETCQDFQGSCVDKGWKCAGEKIPGLCPKKQICCLSGTSRCDVLGGTCICSHSDCSGTMIPGKCSGKHTCCIPGIPACNSSDYTYVEEFNVCIKYYNDSVTSEEAQTRCENDGSQLVTVDTEEKDNFIFNYVKNATGEDDPNYWIGLFWIPGGSDDDWQWSTGQNASETYQGWRPNEPSQSSTYPCGVMTSDSGGWFAADCINRFPSVCENDAFSL